MGSWSLFCLLCRVVCMFVVVGIVVVMDYWLSPQISEFDARPGRARLAIRPSIRPHCFDTSMHVWMDGWLRHGDDACLPGF
jgi:hypothetical protein